MSARATATRAATRREVEQSIARFEKRLDEANSALQTLGTHLGRGAQSGYKDVTSTLRALRRDAAKTNKQALKEFDQLRAALTKSNASGSTRSGSTRSGSTRSGSTRSASTRSTAAKSSTARSTTTRSTAKRTSARTTAAKPATTRATTKRSSGSRSAGAGSRSTRSRAKSS